MVVVVIGYVVTVFVNFVAAVYFILLVRFVVVINFLLFFTYSVFRWLISLTLMVGLH